MKRLFCLTLSLLLIAGCARSGQPGEYARTVSLMDTFVQVKIYEPGYSTRELKKAVDGALELAGNLEKKFSAFDPESEINKLNISGKMNVSPELFDVLKEASQISRITGGAFDITVSPVLKKDGFYKDMPAGLRERIPDSFSGVDWRNVALSGDGKSVNLYRKAWVDLSGIAKGYIVDRMSEFLRDKGIGSFMVNAGGDLFCRAKGDDGKWNIGVRQPGAKNVILVMGVNYRAVATSGDYENVVMDKHTDRPISHIIDPGSDKALAEAYSSATVIAPTCTRADALATAMMVMGSDKSVKLADTMKEVSVIFVESPEGRHKVSLSEGAEQYIIGR